MSKMFFRALLVAGIVASTSLPALAQAVELAPTFTTFMTQGPAATGTLEAWESRLDISVSDFNPGTRLNVFLTLSHVPSQIQASYVGSFVVGDDRTGRFQLQGLDLARAVAVFAPGAGIDGLADCDAGGCGVATLPFVRVYFADPVDDSVGVFDVDGQSGPATFGSVSLPDPLPPTPFTGGGDTAALEAELGRAQARIADLESGLALANESLAAREAELASVTSRLTTVEADLAMAMSDVAAAQARVASLEGELARATADLGAARERVFALESALTQARADRDAAQARNAALAAQLNDAQGALASSDAALAAARARIAFIDTSLAQATADVSAAQARIVGLDGQVSRLTSSLAQAQVRITTLEGQLAAGGVANPTLAAMEAGVRAVEQRLRVMLRNPAFTIPGATTIEKFNHVVRMMLDLNRGRAEGFDDRDRDRDRDRDSGRDREGAKGGRTSESRR